ncbi:hypothetical protein K503DRAFT_864070 [Rhizopogon vinicolor AM-OR11-026]|uniref:Uncharacterized protein n=1 Tax=Rhizopogon vinicolor AM-OR11-026 TaxID=1314800 RepID=A0A1B7N8M9_9AGAM|nr:hypothetical protein K503DRAFT_864070 [Rhizopogon vinicolor AM-OR11-026]
MAPASKARAAGVSASSFFNLKAELANKEDERIAEQGDGQTEERLKKGENWWKVKGEEAPTSRTSEPNTAKAATFKTQESDASDPFAKLERHTAVASDQSKTKGEQKGIMILDEIQEVDNHLHRQCISLQTFGFSRP